MLIWEDFAVGGSTSLAVGVGYWDTDATWHAYGDSYSEYEWRSTVWTLVGLGRRSSVYARLPWMYSRRRATSVQGFGGGIADADVGFRYELLSIGEVAELPGIALTASVLVPTGRATEDANEPLGADTTGRGAWVPALGVTLEKTYLPWFVQLNLGTTVPLPAERSDLEVTQRYGPGAQTSVVGGVEVLPDELVLAASLRYAWEAPVTIAGRTIDDSDRTDVGVGLSVSWRVHPHWTLQSAFDSGLFADHLGKNLPGRITTTVGLRYGHF